MVSHACNPSTLGGGGRQIAWGQEFKTSLANRVKPRLYQKNTKFSRAWWQTPVIPATREAEAEELFDPRRQRLQWAKIVQLHSSLGDRPRPNLKHNKTKEKSQIETNIQAGHGGSLEVRSLRPAWTTWNAVSTKNTKINLVEMACTCNSSYLGG